MKYFRIPTQDIPFWHQIDECSDAKHLDIECKDASIKWLQDLPNSGLAVVGTRHPQKRSLDLVERTISELKGSGLIIVSGFARGIDSFAHECAIKNGLRTLAILGSGIEVLYPKEHKTLKEKILESGGALISPFEPNCEPFKSNFLKRNALIAGLSNAVWVVEAAAVSGTLNTASWASKLNRDLYATSCYPGDPLFQGNQKLLGQQSTERYPLADPFFGVETFLKTWAHLPVQKRKPKKKPSSQLSKWVLKLESEFGECQAQTLLNYAQGEGLGFKEFFALFEQELEQGKLRQTPSGRIEVL